MILRVFSFILLAFSLAACATSDDVIEAPLDLGNFTLAHNVVVASKAATSTAIGREVTEEQLTETLKSAIAKRMDRYEGTRQYHLGVSVEAYILARGGVPVVAAPKSAMIVQVTVWDDEKSEKLNVPPEQITVIEDIDGESIFGSGWLQTPETQLEGLASNAAEAIEQFLLTKNNEYGWFESPEEAARRTEATELEAARAEAERRDEAPPVQIEAPAVEPETPELPEEAESDDSGA